MGGDGFIHSVGRGVYLLVYVGSDTFEYPGDVRFSYVHICLSAALI